MIISEFARKRGVEQQAVYKYIRRHMDLFGDHLSGDPMELDETALRLLSEKYPEKNPVAVVEDTDAYKQLVAAQKQILDLQTQICAYREAQAKAEISERLLEQRDHDNVWLKAQIDRLQGEISQARDDAEAARAEVARLKCRGFWARLFNR